MSKKIQATISDKNNSAIEEIILNNELIGYDGDIIKNISAAASFFIDLGLRVYLSSKNKDESNNLNLDNFRYELFKKVMQSYYINKQLLESLNELSEFENRNLLKEANEKSREPFSNEIKQLFGERK